MNIHDAISAMVRRDETDKGTLTLGEAMDAHQTKTGPGIVMTINGEEADEHQLYRGYYEHLAIATDERQGGERSEVIEPYRGQYLLNADDAEVLIGSCGVVDDPFNALALCIGATFQGQGWRLHDGLRHAGCSPPSGCLWSADRWRLGRGRHSGADSGRR